MGVNVLHVLQDAVDSEFAARIKAALDADAAEGAAVIKEKDEAIAGLHGQIDALAAQVEELKKLEGANYDLKKQLDVKTAENEILRQSVEAFKIRIAQLEAGHTEPEPAPEPELQPTGAPTLAAFKAAANKSTYLTSVEAWFKANTGIPKGTTLTDYTGPMVITKEGTVIEGKRIRGQLQVAAKNVIIRKNLLVGGFWGIEGEHAPNLTIEDNEFTGHTKAILAQGIIRRNYIHDTIIGITLMGGKSIVEWNYINDLKGPAGSHFDGIFISAGQRDCLIGNNFIRVPEQGGTAAIFIATRWKGADIIDTTANENWLLGTPSYAMYNEQTDLAKITGTKWTNNIIQKGGYGYWTWQDSTPVRSGNVDALTGKPI